MFSFFTQLDLDDLLDHLHIKRQSQLSDGLYSAVAIESHVSAHIWVRLDF